MMNPSNFDQSNLIGSLSIVLPFLTLVFLCLLCLKTEREHSSTVSSNQSFQQVFFTNLSFNHGSSTVNQLVDIQRWSSIDSPELTFYRITKPVHLHETYFKPDTEQNLYLSIEQSKELKCEDYRIDFF